ncbi:MAG: VCBS repeat-containing protein [Betaproteobacteria bacterium]|nr:VCBS repeat-containing protein [Betaproteobacteria bacterium]
MKITQSQLAFSTSHLATKESRTQESFKFSNPNSRPGLNPTTAGSPTAAGALTPENTGSPVQISDAGRQNLQAKGTRRTNNPSRQVDNDPKLTLLRMAIEMITGKKANVCDAELGDPQSAANGEGGIGMSYERHSYYTETEMSSFSAQGMVRTADGQEINFQLELTMFRAFHSEEHVGFSLGKLQDPLVLNFAGTAAELSDTRFKFDLFGNGQDVDMRALQPGSGFLVFDRNGDGKVNDGRELFGTVSGNGFADLAALDDDGNGWIDEGDSAFNSLYIWNKDANGNDKMTSLKDLGVGAIALTYANTPFSLKDANNKLLGQITGTSVFLMEKGGVGTVQKVDVVV